MPLTPKLDAVSVEKNMTELEPPYTPQEALLEANRCLFCFDAPCIQACPTGIDIPSFIKKIATNNLTGSARTILSANILGASCARVCPTEVLCEGACVMLDLEKDPIQIGRLQRHATDHVFNNNIQIFKAPQNKTGKKIAIIGGGPTGLGCAAELAQLGHTVVIFEKKSLAGGLNTYGIAYYKMRPEISLKEVELVKSLGVEIRCNTEVGKDISISQIEKDFDAIFVGIGLGAGQLLGIPGENLPEVVDAIEFIEQIHALPLDKVAIGNRVAIIGCGNTAIDAVTQSKRLGAERAAVIYRRGEADMSAYEFEYELAKNDGAEFLFNTIPLEVVATNGHVSGLKMAKTQIDAQGKVNIIPGSEFVEEFDMVIKAVGQEKQAEFLKSLFPKLEIDKKGRVVHNSDTGQTNLTNVFCGGDCANGGREVVNAVGEGKKAARGIHALFQGQKVVGPIQPSRYGVKGQPVGSGLDRPIRVPELEAQLAAKNNGNKTNGNISKRNVSSVTHNAVVTQSKE